MSINSNKIFLNAILIVSVMGLLFSGYLSYIELSGQAATCKIAREITGIPTCVYGFVMYAIIFTMALLLFFGLKKQLARGDRK